MRLICHIAGCIYSRNRSISFIRDFCSIFIEFPYMFYYSSIELQKIDPSLSMRISLVSLIPLPMCWMTGHYLTRWFKFSSWNLPPPDIAPTYLSQQLSHFSSHRFTILIMPSRKPKPNQRWSMYSVLHEDVSHLLEEDDLHFDFNENDDTTGCIKKYDTNIMGRFACRNQACDSSGWSSKRIAITIRMYPGARYNARVYNQRCQACNSLSKPRLDDSYAERVVYRIKKWCGIEMDMPHYSGHSERPHQSDLCEGCKDGHCSQLWPR